MAFFLGALNAGAHGALHDGVHKFEVRGVVGEGQVNEAASGFDAGREAHVVFDVTAASALRRVFAFEFVEKVGGAFAEDVDQHVEAATVRHRNADFFAAAGAKTVYQGFGERDEAVAPFQREAFLPDETFVQVFFQTVGGDKLLQERAFFFVAIAVAVCRFFQTLLQPAALFGGVDVQYLRTDVVFIRLVKVGDDVAQGHVAAEQRAGIKGAVKVGVGQAVPAVINIRHFAARAQMNRAEVGGLVATSAVAGNQPQHSNLFRNRFRVGFTARQIGQIGHRLKALLHRQARFLVAGTGADAVKISTPLGSDAVRCVQILLVQRLNISGITAAELTCGTLCLVISHVVSPV